MDKAKLDWLRMMIGLKRLELFTKNVMVLNFFGQTFIKHVNKLEKFNISELFLKSFDKKSRLKIL